MTMDFAVHCSLVRPGRPHIRFLSIGSRLCSTLPSDPASRRRPCASLALRRHQAGQRTFTSKLSNMLGTQQKTARRAVFSTLFFLIFFGAGEGIRTLDPNLGKVVLGLSGTIQIYPALR